MKWYIAHVIMYVKFKHGKQGHYPIWENLHLIKASSPEKAWEWAEKCGREAEGDDSGSFRWGDRPATWVYAGTRKVIECGDAGHAPVSGTEVTFSELRVESLAALKRLISGEPVRNVCGMTEATHAPSAIRSIASPYSAARRATA